MSESLIFYTLFLPSEKRQGVSKVKRKETRQKAVKRIKQQLSKQFPDLIKVEI